jgi:hypothetical protein
MRKSDAKIAGLELTIAYRVPLEQLAQLELWQDAHPLAPVEGENRTAPAIPKAEKSFSVSSDWQQGQEMESCFMETSFSNFSPQPRHTYS